MEEKEKVKSFVTKGCGCELTSGKPCSTQLNFESILNFRSQCKELTKAEFDMAILGQLNAFTHSGEQKANDTTHRHSSEGRQREYSLYWHHWYRVCRTTFLFLHSSRILNQAYILMGSHPVTMAIPSDFLQILSTLLTRKQLGNS